MIGLSAKLLLKARKEINKQLVYRVTQILEIYLLLQVIDIFYFYIYLSVENGPSSPRLQCILFNTSVYL